MSLRPAAHAAVVAVLQDVRARPGGCVLRRRRWTWRWTGRSAGRPARPSACVIHPARRLVPLCMTLPAAASSLPAYVAGMAVAQDVRQRPARRSVDEHSGPTVRQVCPQRLRLIHSRFRREKLSEVADRFIDMTPTAPHQQQRPRAAGRRAARHPAGHPQHQRLQTELATVTPQVGRLLGWLSAAAGQLDHRTAGTVTDDDTGPPARSAGWLADPQHATPSAAGTQLRTARLLRSMPLVCDAVLDGVLTQQQATVLTRLVGKIQPDALTESQPHLIAVAATMDPAQLSHWVAHQLATHCEPVFDAEQERAHAKRYLTHRRDDDGSLFGRFRLPAEDAETLLTALEPLARRNRDLDTRTAGQRRADALVEMAEQVLRHGELGDAGGLRPQLNYVLPAGWAAAQQARATCTACGPRCADHQPLTFGDTVTAAMPGQGGIRAEQACATAAWTGPQTRARIETLLCDARITRVLLSPLGQVTGFQPLRDSITPAQRRNLAARDLGCVVRGCTRPPAMCDAHHLRATSRRRPDDHGQPRPALPTPPRPLAPRQTPAPPPQRPLAPRTDRSTTRPAQRPVPGHRMTAVRGLRRASAPPATGGGPPQVLRLALERKPSREQQPERRERGRDGEADGAPAGLAGRQAHRDEGAEHPGQLQRGLRAGEGAAERAAGHVLLQRGVEGEARQRHRDAGGGRRRDDPGVGAERARRRGRRRTARRARSTTAGARSPRAAGPPAWCPTAGRAPRRRRRAPTSSPGAPSARSRKARNSVSRPASARSATAAASGSVTAEVLQRQDEARRRRRLAVGRLVDVLGQPQGQHAADDEHDARQAQHPAGPDQRADRRTRARRPPRSR